MSLRSIRWCHRYDRFSPVEIPDRKFTHHADAFLSGEFYSCEIPDRNFTHSAGAFLKSVCDSCEIPQRNFTHSGGVFLKARFYPCQNLKLGPTHHGALFYRRGSTLVIGSRSGSVPSRPHFRRLIPRLELGAVLGVPSSDSGQYRRTNILYDARRVHLPSRRTLVPVCRRIRGLRL